MGTPVQERLVVALNEVFNALNVLGSNNSAVVRDFFSRQHRTLQQQFVKVVVLPVLEQLAQADKEGRTDLRNEAAAHLATKMLAATTEDDRWLPLV
jgi:exonuclease VII large subunit